MAGTEFTPGPWNHNRGDQYVSGFYGSVNARKVASRPEGLMTDWNADARLIASAPEILEALKKIAENDLDGLHMLTPQSMQEIARAAIAKAEGKP